MPSALVDADAAAGGISLTGQVAVVDPAAVAVAVAGLPVLPLHHWPADPAAVAVAMAGLPVLPLHHWPADLLLKCGLTSMHRLQNIEINGCCFKKFGGIERLAAGLSTSFRLLDEDKKSQAAAAIVMPVTKVIIAPH